ncbi:MAG TPA: CpsD/CapB family tyrosine-protein kinase [Solirubrobacteraceae bacterium]|nr:CpsD/CapB family tyrosine-protein kinase [Solirubrobacteraceae bacterium]
MSTRSPHSPAADSIDLRATGKAFWRWKLLFLACVLLLPAGAYYLSASNRKVYQASALMRVQADPVDTSLIQGTPPPTQPQATQTAARLIQTTDVARAAAQLLNPHPHNPRALLGTITATADDIGFITITAQASSATRAAAVANAFANAVVAGRVRAARGQVHQTIIALRQQLDSVRRSDSVQRQQLSAQLQRFRALLAAQGSNAAVVEPAIASGQPVSPRPTRSALLALVVAVLIGGGLVALAQNLDRRVRRQEELEELTGRPLLATIPKSAFAQPRNAPARAFEAFQTLRAALMYFNIDRVVSSVLVTSPARDDGKTTVAINLARALARGGKNVVLVDADLRKPQIAERLELRTSGGMGNVLVGEATLEEVLAEVEVPVGDGRLRVMPSSTAPPNPSELLNSRRMRELLQRLEQMSDIVVIDTSPMLAVSDAIPLLDQVSGVLLLGRVNVTRRDAFRRLLTTVQAARGVTLGVVATGVRDSGVGGYYHDYPSSNGRASSVNGARPVGVGSR